MLGDYFYHESLRKIIIAFGTIFNNIHIHRKDSNGNVIQSLKVPLAYSPKEKFIARLDQQPDLVQDRRVAVTLPRMGFEISGLSYDPSRKLNRMGQVKKVRSTSTDGKIMNKQIWERLIAFYSSRRVRISLLTDGMWYNIFGATFGCGPTHKK